MLRNLYLLGILCLFIVPAAHAQVGAGTLKGKLTDAETGEPLPFVNIVLQTGDRQVAGGATDIDGNYTIKPIAPGEYNVAVSYVGYNAKQIQGVIVTSNKISFLDIQLDSGIELTAYEVVEYTQPLIDKDGGPSGRAVTRDEIVKMPGRSATSMAATVGGVQTNADGVSLRGGREGNTFFYIDGIKVRGSNNLPKAALEEVQVLTGGIPANFGDVTGGLINITTRGATSEWFGSLDVLTSGFANEDDGGVGLDGFSQTQVEAVISGPLLFKKDAAGNKEKPLIGFFLSGNYRNFMDTRPSAIGNFRLKDDVLADISANPLNFVFNGVNVVGSEGVFIDPNGNVQPATTVTPNIQGNQSSLFLREDDWENVRARQNSRLQGGSFTTKIDIATTPNIDFSVGGTFDVAYSRLYDYNNSMFNYENNAQRRDLTYRAFARFTQRFNNTEAGQGESESLIKNAFYSLMVDYEQRDVRTWDPRHEDRLFNYAYVGAFDQVIVNNYAFRDDTAAAGFYHDGFRTIETTFTPSTTNPNLAAYTSTLYDFYEDQGFTVRDPNDIDAAGGLRNGRLPADVYDLYRAAGRPFNNYGLFNTNQFRVTGSGSADIGGHAITIGFEYEQFTQRSFSATPNNLWNVARQYANDHITELDFNSTPSVHVTNGQTFYTFDRLIGDNQTTFDRNLRTALGLDPNGSDFIILDNINPDLFTLDMFSPDELLNQGNDIVAYYGYDPFGNKLTGRRPTIDDFFTSTDANGNKTRLQAAYEPIYISGYIMDKFAFDDIIFNVGVRVDRFDANQPVLKDQFVIGEALTVADTRNEGGRFFFNEHPGNVGDDWVVYVNDLQDPTGVNGYRDGNTWFNAQGVEVADPRVLRTASGIAPLLADPNAVGENLTSGAFEDYRPQINVMPRVSFSFPISDEAVFFAHYDILTQRPTDRETSNLADYLFIQARGNRAINNPNLRPTRTTDYELGFQQVLSKSSSLKIAAFYRETQDEIQARRLLEAFPVTYTSFDNFDFGTVKGLTLTYDLRKTGNVTLRAAYTLQFASATGSNSGSAINLVNSGEPNLRVIFPTSRDQRHLLITTFDYRYGTGKNYNGPVVNGKQILANTGLNIVSTLGSGTPYSQQIRATPEAFINPSGSPQLLGTVNGSRLPWQFRVDAQIDKSWPLTFAKGSDKEKQAFLNVYFLFNNLLNAQNIIGVYRFTGNPNDDGFLNAPQFQPTIESQLDEESFRQMYAQKVDSPFNYGTARTIQLGVRLDF
jgi:hypothetical protein